MPKGIRPTARVVNVHPEPPIFQAAYLVADIEDAAGQWAATTGAGPFFVTEHHVADRFAYRGTTDEADVTYAFGYSGSLQIQLVQQHDDTPSIYRDMFPDGGYGHHHVARLVHDYNGHRERLLDAGHELACELHANGIDAAYFDTRAAIGCYTELHSHTDRIEATFARWRDAHDAWDGNGPCLRVHVSGT